MNEKSEEFIECFIAGELTGDNLRRAIYLTVHDEAFRSKVRSTLAIRELVRFGYTNVLRMAIQHKPS